MTNKQFTQKENKKGILKSLIKKLHEGVDPAEIKEKFREIIESVTPTELSKVEEELIKEGMPRKEIQALCDIHIDIFREALEKEKTIAPIGHPIQILLEEHKIIKQFTNKLKDIANKIIGAKDFDSVSEELKQISHIIKHFKESESHYVREENVLFPYLEKHGITEPPTVMWTEHNKIRELKKKIYTVFEAQEKTIFQYFTKQLEESAIYLNDMLSNHFYKEGNILFPTALKVIDETEWIEIRIQFDNLGYCCFTPQPPKVISKKEEIPISETELEGMISFETGGMSKEELEILLNTLPVDITFVDKEDTVRYFSQTEDRIFPRTKAVIGRKVQKCHPQKSVHIVNQILEDFKNNKRDIAEFWINLNNRLIYIRYFPVRNKDGDYLGCLEVTQDITDIKKIEGEKRL